MKVNRPGDPLSGSTEPLDPRDLQNLVKGERFRAVLSELEASAETSGTGDAPETGGASGGARAALAQIASGVDFANAGQALVAVRESARYMVRSRLSKQHRETKEGAKVVDALSDYISSDPLLKSKLLSILHKVKSAR